MNKFDRDNEKAGRAFGLLFGLVIIGMLLAAL